MAGGWVGGSLAEQPLDLLDVRLRRPRRRSRSSGCSCEDLSSSRWRPSACSRMTLPVPVRRKRFFVPLCVLIFGMGADLLACRCVASPVGAAGGCLRWSRDGRGRRRRCWRPVVPGGWRSAAGLVCRLVASGRRGGPSGLVGWCVLRLVGVRSRRRARACLAVRARRCSAIASDFFLVGPSTMIMLRPSCLGADSTKPSSMTSSARRWSSR